MKLFGATPEAPEDFGTTPTLGGIKPEVLAVPFPTAALGPVVLDGMKLFGAVAEAPEDSGTTPTFLGGIKGEVFGLVLTDGFGIKSTFFHAILSSEDKGLFSFGASVSSGAAV